MTKATIAAAALLVALALALCCRAHERDVDPAATTSSPIIPSTAAVDAHPSLLYGRVTTRDGATYEGRLRWGGNEEASWGDTFNGFKNDNPWANHVAPERLPTERHTIEILGIELWSRENPLDLGRPFMTRFGDIARIDAERREIRVTLKSGTMFILDRFEADDLADGLRVWDATRGVVDFDEWRIRVIELFPAPSPGADPNRLHGTVRTREGDFTGFIQWNREKGLGTDELAGHTTDGALSLRFDTIRSIARSSRDGARVTLSDGLELALSEVGRGNRGVYVDDPRYGRVLVSWDAFERIDFSPGGSGPFYDDFPPGRPLTGSVTTRAGATLTGRLVFDLDESETTETLDAPSAGVDYTIPFGLIDSIVLPGPEDSGARVTLQSGEELELEPAGDLGELNAGMLIFADGGERPEYVAWTDVERVVFDPPPAMYPPLAER
ncbi:MAG: hypothetical protein R3344_05525 [Acidobacteriota bacterium]|nr:hypothetical protein [Acidobacteriota bacterium]